MVNILIKTDSRYQVDKKQIRTVIERYFLQKNLKGTYEVSINIAGDRLMRKLNRQYRELDQTTDVLSFSLVESKNEIPFTVQSDGILRLGDIVVSFPQAVENALTAEKKVDDVIGELILHGLDHLFGIHHS